MTWRSLSRPAAAVLVALSFAAPARAQVPVEVLHTFAPSGPNSPTSLVAGSDGNLYGTDAYGGAFGYGTVFRLTPGGTLTILKAFDSTQAYPDSIVEGGGVLYGVLQGGSASLRGAVFAIGLDGSGFRIVRRFEAADNISAFSWLVRSPDGTLFGATLGGPYGSAYKIDPASGLLTVLHIFQNQADGAIRYPTALVAGADGNLYGTAAISGGFDVPLVAGLVFRVTPAGSFSVVHRFDCSVEPVCLLGGLLQASDGSLYTTTSPFPSPVSGAVLRIALNGDTTTVASIQSPHPGDLVQASDGNFYGANGPTLFRLTPAGIVTALHELSANEGTVYAFQRLPLVATSDGRIYGATNGGAQGRGTVFRLTTGGAFATLHAFAPGSEGVGPTSVVRMADGSLYGTARSGGAAGYGTFYRVAPDGTLTVLHSFAGGDEGAYPLGITLATDGNFYGALQHYVSPTNAGVLFRATPAGDVTVLHTFPPNTTGTPVNIPMQASDGWLYGMTDGTIYRSSLDGVVTTVHEFDLPPSPREVIAVRSSSLVEASDGSLYGALEHGNTMEGQAWQSRLFRLTSDRTYVPLHTFEFSVGGPAGPLVVGRDGNIYGTTPLTFFQVTPAGTFTTLVTLQSKLFGSALVQASDGDFYAAFYKSLPQQFVPGGVCRLTTAGSFSVVTGRATERLLQTPDGLLLGTNSNSPTTGMSGEIFRFALPEVMALDTPLAHTTVPQPFVLGGWAIDRTATAGSGVDAVHVWAIPAAGGPAIFVGAADYFATRGDVAGAYGDQFVNSGYQIVVHDLPPGAYTLVAYAHSSETGSFNQARAVSITVPASQPALAIDSPSTVVHSPFWIAGWALDASDPVTTGVDAVHVYAVPAAGPAIFLGAATYGQARPDVGQIYGAHFTNVGYSLYVTDLALGDYTLVVYAHSLVSGAWFGQSRHLTVRQPGDPHMSVDTPTDGTTRGSSFLLAGWALDLDATSGPGVDVVHVWAVPTTGDGPAIFAGAASTGGLRNDVGAAFGSQFATSGYNLTVSGLGAGTYQLVVYAHSTVTGTFNQERVVTITIQP